jgi:hypothetical protein
MIRRVPRAVASARAEDLFLYSAALAFYGLISVAPLVVVALWVTSLVVGPTQIDDATAELARFGPEALGARLWLFAANTVLLVGLRAAHRRRLAVREASEQSTRSTGLESRGHGPPKPDWKV